MLGLDPSTAIGTGGGSGVMAFGDRIRGGARVKPEHDGKNGSPDLKVKPDSTGLVRATSRGTVRAGLARTSRAMTVLSNTGKERLRAL
jgi:hypothetical protein